MPGIKLGTIVRCKHGDGEVGRVRHINDNGFATIFCPERQVEYTHQELSEWDVLELPKVNQWVTHREDDMSGLILGVTDDAVIIEVAGQVGNPTLKEFFTDWLSVDPEPEGTGKLKTFEPIW